jgi:hypothetical protein
MGSARRNIAPPPSWKWRQHPGISIGPPYAVSLGADRAALFMIGTKRDVRVRWWDKEGWGEWESLGDRPMIATPFAISREPNCLDVFCVDSAHSIFHRHWDDGAWEDDWAELGGEAGGLRVKAPHAVTWDAGRLDLFVHGTDYNIYHKFLQGETWSEWDSIGEEMISPPFAVAPRPGVLEVIAIDGYDHCPKKKTWRNGHWEQRWNSVCEGNAISTPYAVVRNTGAVDVFFRGEKRAVYQHSSGWQTQEPYSLGGTATLDPCVIYWPDDRVDLFVVGEDSAVWKRTRRGDRWNPWTSLDGQAFSAVSYMRRGEDDLELFVWGKDSHIWSLTVARDQSDRG